MRLATASNYKYTMMVSQKLRDKVCVLCKAKANIRSWMIVTPLRSALFRIRGASCQGDAGRETSGCLTRRTLQPRCRFNKVRIILVRVMHMPRPYPKGPRICLGMD